MEEKVKYCFIVVIVSITIAFIAGYLTGRPRPKVVSPAYIVETIPRTDTMAIIQKVRDSRAEVELSKLRAQLMEKQGVISRLMTDIQGLEVRMRFVTDSVVLAELGKRGGMLLVSFNRGRLGVWALREGVVTEWRGGTDRNRWKLWMGDGGVRLGQTRFPPIGVVAFGRFHASYDALVVGVPTVGVGLYIHTKPLCWRINITNRREVEVGVELGFEF